MSTSVISGGRWSRAAILAGTVALVSVVLTAGGFWLTGQNGDQSPAEIAYLTIGWSAIIGAVVASRRPQDAIGWILCAIAFVGGLATFAYEYGYRAAVVSPGSLPFGIPALWVGTTIWIWAVGIGTPALTVRLPNGRVAREWRVVDWLAVAGTAVLFMATAVMPGTIDGLGRVRNPFGIDGADTWLVGMGWLGYGLVGAAVIGSVASLIARFGTAKGDEREQLKWIASAAALVTAALVYGFVTQVAFHESLFNALVPLFATSVTIPVAIGIAVLKYRLYEIDLIINRALVYGGLTAMLAGIYAVSIGLAQRLVAVSGQRSDVAILLTALVVATAFTPIKEWLQKTVDRRFAARDPAAAANALRDQVEVIVNVIDAPRIARRLVDDSLAIYQAKYAALYLQRHDQLRPFHSSGASFSEPVLKIPLRCDGKELGVLALGERGGRAAFTDRDREALQHCADALAEAIALWNETAVRSG